MTERRAVLKGVGALAGAGIFGFPSFDSAAARAAGAPLRRISVDEATTLETFAETLVPGAQAAGIAHFIDAQLSGAQADSLLMLRYLDVSPPWDGFYRTGLAALDAAARTRHGNGFTKLADGDRLALVKSAAAAPLDGWAGPPSPLFAFAVRADAVDVVYGTVAGFGRLGVEYLAHIEPEQRW